MRPRGKLYRFDIQPEDIEKGERSSSRCPAVLALRRRFPEKKTIFVTGGMVHMDSDRFLVDNKLRNWILSFDGRVSVQPDFFFLEQISWERAPIQFICVRSTMESIVSSLFVRLLFNISDRTGRGIGVPNGIIQRTN